MKKLETQDLGKLKIVGLESCVLEKLTIEWLNDRKIQDVKIEY